MGFAFAHHFATHDAVDAMRTYRRDYVTTGWRASPYAILAVAAIVAETDADAERLAASTDFNRLQRERGQYAPLISVEDALAYRYTENDRAIIARNRARLFVGSPSTVVEKLMPLIEATQANEVMVITSVFDHAARRRSYELLAQAFELEK